MVTGDCRMAFLLGYTRSTNGSYWYIQDKMSPDVKNLKVISNLKADLTA
jgi:hypothetical protein